MAKKRLNFFGIGSRPIATCQPALDYGFSLNSLLVFLFFMWQAEAEALCWLTGVEFESILKKQQKEYCNLLYYFFSCLIYSHPNAVKRTSKDDG
jgi:hypothetical protein